MTLRRTTTVTSAAVLATVVALSSCAGGSEDSGPTGASLSSPESSSAPLNTSSAPHSTSSTPTKSTLASSAAGPIFPKGVPAAAQQRTGKGAMAFTAHFIKQLNLSWTSADPTLLKPLCVLPGSKACDAYIRTATDLRSKKQRYDGDPLTFSSLLILAPEGDKTPVLMNGVQNRRNVISKRGTIILTDARKTLRIVFALIWTNTG